jgi:hypothetical protein
LKNQIDLINQKITRLNNISKLAENTLLNYKGVINMNNKEKFEAFKDNMIKENDTKYGAEAEKLYGKKTVIESNNKLKSMTAEQYKELENLSKEVNNTFAEAYKNNDIKSEITKKAVELHKKWLSFFWSSYNSEAHKGLGLLYTEDDRFRAYYDKISDGLADFIKASIDEWVDKI